ncbi:RNA polymerase sigma factor [Nocardioides limicola]|uniref:RNA polymerase sigma factor n=1 Tax=Nocardioides limicola TaxID=2803368 RepID=UPI00193C3A57|nr:sigma-70 family RNA polymerase sigma factor [Nocardioides sp. DJM-14]
MTQQRSSERLWSEAAELFSRWRDGEPAAIDELVRLLTPVLWQIARSQRLDEERASDVVQSTWLALVRHPESVRDPGAIGGWLATTTRREAWRVARGTDDELPTLDIPSQRTRSAEDEAATRWEARALWDAVGQLSERCQRLLRVAAFLDRPNYAQLAADLGMPVGSIGPTRGRCLARLRTLLRGEGFDQGGDHA